MNKSWISICRITRIACSVKPDETESLLRIEYTRNFVLYHTSCNKKSWWISNCYASCRKKMKAVSVHEQSPWVSLQRSRVSVKETDTKKQRLRRITGMTADTRLLPTAVVILTFSLCQFRLYHAFPFYLKSCRTMNLHFVTDLGSKGVLWQKLQFKRGIHLLKQNTVWGMDIYVSIRFDNNPTRCFIMIRSVLNSVFSEWTNFSKQTLLIETRELEKFIKKQIL